jgi:uncharacterized phosphosugar-binding protein
MYLDEYFTAIEDVLARIRSTQIESIKKAAEIIASSLANKGVFAVMDTGHMLKHEALCRAGGLMVITPFSYGLNVEETVEQRPVTRSVEEAADLETRTVALALDSSKLRRGDVLVINSNSGRTANVIEVAIQCKARGIATIGIASFEQMAKCFAAHSSGKKLVDVADLCIDNCGPYGDAMVEVQGNEKMCPASGLAATYVFWAVHAEVVERLQARGVNPTIYRSVHVGGQEYIDRQRKYFLEHGI